MLSLLQQERDAFIQKNFTAKEQAYCRSAADPAASFAGRWAAKEAVVKAITNSATDTQNLWVRTFALPSPARRRRCLYCWPYSLSVRHTTKQLPKVNMC